MIAQIINGNIDPSWVLNGLIVIVGYFTVRTLVRIEKKQKEHDTQIKNITLIQLQMLAKLGVDDAFYHDLMKDIKSDE